MVGNTPLVALRRLGEGLDAEVVAKLESMNPGRLGQGPDRGRDDRRGRGRGADRARAVGDRRADLGQHRDRAGDGLRGARLPAGPDPAGGDGRERSALLRTYGAVVRETPSMGGMNEAVDLAREIASDRDAFMPQQFNNPANPEIHRRTTAEEIWRDLDGEVDALVCGVGTGGTITGVGQVLKERRPDGAGGRASSRPRSPVLSGGEPGPAQDPGNRRRLRAGGARPLGDRRDRSRSRTRRAVETAAPGRHAARGCWSGSPPGPRSTPRSSSPRAAEMAGKRIVVDRPRRRRALHVAAVLRP